MKITSKTVALITGGSSGIGRECSDRILSAGGRVVIVDYDEVGGKKTVQEFSQQYSADRIHFIKCDVADHKQLDAAFTETTDKYKRLDIVFNNAGIGEKTQWQEAVMSGSQMPSDWFNTIRIDLDAVVNGTRLAVREMLKLNGGKPGGRKGEALGVIINTASMGGIHPMPFSPVYCAAKHAVIGFTRSCRVLREVGIRVSAICPSFADTALVRNGMASSEAYRNHMNKLQQVTGPLLHTKEVANAFDIIVKDEGMSGAVISITQELGIAQHYVVKNVVEPQSTIKLIVNREENRKIAKL